MKETGVFAVTIALIAVVFAFGVHVHNLNKLDNTLNKIHDRLQEIRNETR